MQLTNTVVQRLGGVPGGFRPPVGPNLIPLINQNNSEYGLINETVDVVVQSIAWGNEGEPYINTQLYVAGVIPDRGNEAFHANLFYIGSRGAQTRFSSVPEP